MKNTKHITIEIDDLTEIIENHYLLGQATERLKNNNDNTVLSQEDVMAALGLSQDDIDSAEDLEIE